MFAAQQRLQSALAGFNRLTTQILAIELEQVEGAKDRRMAGPVPADEVEHRKAFMVGDYRLAVDEAGACRQRRDRCGGQWEASSEIVAVSSEEPHTGSIAPCHDAEAVVLDLMQPVPADRRPVGRAGKARLNDAS
jgi:hypothetical protein